MDEKREAERTGAYATAITQDLSRLWMINHSLRPNYPNLEFDQWLRATRLVSQDFYTIATPFVYKNFGSSDEFFVGRLIYDQDDLNPLVKERDLQYTTQLRLPSIASEHIIEDIAILTPLMESLDRSGYARNGKSTNFDILEDRWWDMFSIDTLRAVGANLRSLKLCVFQTEEYRDRLLDTNGLYLIRDQCPQLEILNIDVDFDQPEEKLNSALVAISRFQSLTKLHISAGMRFIRKGCSFDSIDSIDPEFDCGATHLQVSNRKKPGKESDWVALHRAKISGITASYWAYVGLDTIWNCMPSRFLVSENSFVAFKTLMFLDNGETCKSRTFPEYLKG
ncbi:uncharacterized protein RSE6_01835 [Rhynchosporium secalis]|uniref:Uncharacterized protein n=1 Tax=Rhynchosporium secalis TaxID=38038 RepID=A0A1E1LYU0_RHYSE|nr:uncharacterized protein RSE6_01835 [Rhynchosporium secalis]